MTEGSTQDFQRLAARADLARLLAASYYQPDVSFAEEGLCAQIAHAADGLDPDLATRARRLATAFDSEDLQARLIDYARLFLGPPKALAQPYGSVWLTQAQSLMQDSTMAVLGLYREAGFAIVDDFRDLPDHLSAELEFLYVLLFRAAQAHASGDLEALRTAVALRDRLIDEHLGRWVPPFAAAVRGAAQTRFYRELVELTQAFIAGVRDGAPKA